MTPPFPVSTPTEACRPLMVLPDSTTTLPEKVPLRAPTRRIGFNSFEAFGDNSFETTSLVQTFTSAATV